MKLQLNMLEKVSGIGLSYVHKEYMETTC